MLKKSKTDNQMAMEASYKVCYQIALAGEAHLIAESHIKPCVKYILSCVFGEEYVKQIEAVPLSNTTVSRRINDIPDYLMRTYFTITCIRCLCITTRRVSRCCWISNFTCFR